MSIRVIRGSKEPIPKESSVSIRVIRGSKNPSIKITKSPQAPAHLSFSNSFIIINN